MRRDDKWVRKRKRKVEKSVTKKHDRMGWDQGSLPEEVIWS